MSAEDQINMLNQIPPVSNFEMRRSRRIAVVLAAAMILSILFFVYAFLQRIEADKQRAIAIVNLEEARRSEQEGMIMAEMARKQQAIAEQQLTQALQALENCKKSKQ